MSKSREKMEPRAEQPRELSAEVKEQQEVSEQNFLQEYDQKAMQPRALAETRLKGAELLRRFRMETDLVHYPDKEQQRLIAEQGRLEAVTAEMGSVIDGHYRELVSLLTREQYTARAQELRDKLGGQEPPDWKDWLKTERTITAEQEIAQRELRAISEREEKYALSNQKLRAAQKEMRGLKPADTETGPEHDEVTALLDKYGAEVESFISGGGFTHEERREHLIKLGEELDGAVDTVAEKASLTKAKARLGWKRLKDIVKNIKDAAWIGLTAGQG